MCRGFVPYGRGSVLQSGRSTQGLSQDFKNACPKQQYQNFARPDLATNLLQILIPATFNSLVCKKGNLHSYVLEDGWLG